MTNIAWRISELGVFGEVGRAGGAINSTTENHRRDLRVDDSRRINQDLTVLIYRLGEGPNLEFSARQRDREGERSRKTRK